MISTSGHLISNFPEVRFHRTRIFSKRYDEYEPWKYACISVDDAYLEGVVERLTSIDFYWHTLSVKGKGLAYCGVTLVPPCSLKAFIDVIADNSELSELKKLLENALSNNKWVIHYGL